MPMASKSEVSVICRDYGLSDSVAAMDVGGPVSGNKELVKAAL